LEELSATITSKEYGGRTLIKNIGDIPHKQLKIWIKA
jgi:hypothetical protein